MSRSLFTYSQERFLVIAPVISYIRAMKRRIKKNNLIPWFTEDQKQLPKAYVASCQKFFLELDRRQADKKQVLKDNK